MKEVIIPAIKTPEDFQAFCKKPGGLELLHDMINGSTQARKHVQPKLSPKMGRVFLVLSVGNYRETIQLPPMPLTACQKLSMILTSLYGEIAGAFTESLILCPEDSAFRGEDGLPYQQFSDSRGIAHSHVEFSSLREFFKNSRKATKDEVKNLIDLIKSWKRDQAKTLRHTPRDEVVVKISPSLEEKSKGHNGQKVRKIPAPLVIKKLRKNIAQGEVLQSTETERGMKVEVFIPFHMGDRVSKWLGWGYNSSGNFPQQRKPNFDSQFPSYKTRWTEG
jgi:hypothetical protein